MTLALQKWRKLGMFVGREGFCAEGCFGRDGFRYSWLPSLAVIVGRMTAKFIMDTARLIVIIGVSVGVGE